MSKNNELDQIAVIGLGYVGLPLAVALSKHFKLIGIDVSEKRINELKKGFDINNETTQEELDNKNLYFTSDFSKISDVKFVIVTVPTPVDKNKRPDLSPLYSASKELGKNITEDTIIVFESTVYPGVTEEYCVPIIEKYSGLKYGIDFHAGYSPERINPGDKVHSIENVVKIISADNEKSLEKLDFVYGKIVKKGLYKAKSIKTAEMAKVIENTQRDINIALMNEIALICHKLNLSTKDVLDAARTKWNFLPFTPGLVGGHCIGVDPYYLTFKCEELNYHPEMILSGRRINDGMGKYIAEVAIKKLISNSKTIKNSNVLILGVTFKENIKDIRNSKVLDIVNELKEYQVNVFVNDPQAEPDHVKKEFNVDSVSLENIKNMDCIIFAVQHKEYLDFTPEFFKNLCNKEPVFIDVKSCFDKDSLEKVGFNYFSL
jgi:UDP-N-acetyl-D-galactosamine dehydrogenase